MPYATIEVIKTPANVALVWLNRPDVRNALNEAMLTELTEAFQELDEDRDVRAVVLAAHGKAFCAGADLEWIKRSAEFTFEQNFSGALVIANTLRSLHELRKPTIARVHGAAYAGGMGLVAACDIAVAAIGAEFCLSEVKLGLVPATISPYVIAAMGERMAHRYMLTAEPFDAAEAYRIGFVQDIVQPHELDERINTLLGYLVGGAPSAHAATKNLIGAVARQPLTTSLIEDTAERFAAARASDDGKEGVRAFLEKRKPAWVPVTGGQKRPRRGKSSD